jgi:hypothetical protein
MTRPSKSEVEDIEEQDFLDNIGDDDFLLILDSNGDLKTILLPESLTENIPKNLVQILKILGIDNHNLQSRTIH